jgi:hypothetical protein
MESNAGDIVSTLRINIQPWQQGLMQASQDGALTESEDGG